MVLLFNTSRCSEPISKYSWMITQIHRSVELDKLECLFTRLSASYSVRLKLNYFKANCVTSQSACSKELCRELNVTMDKDT